MYLTIFKLLLAIFLINKVRCSFDENEIAQDFANELEETRNFDILNLENKRPYVKSKPFLHELLFRNSENMDIPTWQRLLSRKLNRINELNGEPFYDESILDNQNEKLAENLYMIDSLIPHVRQSKRLYLGSAERIMKGKRVNNNNNKKMFSSGLQGVWGVPGKK